MDKIEPYFGPSAEPPAEVPVVDKLETDADGGELFGIHVISLFLTIITLGIYRFWWKTRVRRYLMSHMRYKDDAFEYTGTGLELFIGFVIVFFVLLLPLAGVIFLSVWLTEQGYVVLGSLIPLIIYLGIFMLFGAAIYRALKYRLSRTLWRGIRGNLSGSSIGYSIRYFLYTLLQFVTLGLATPYVTIRLYDYMLNNVWLGSGRLQFSTDWKPLFGKYILPGIVFGIGMAVVIVGYVEMFQASFASERAMDLDDEQGMREAGEQVLSALGVIGIGFVILMTGVIGLFWYVAALYRTILDGLTFEGVAFSGKLTGGRYLKFNLFNWFILIFTYGIAYPWVQVRWLKLIAEVVEIHGEPDFAQIAQSTADMPKFGEGLAEAIL